MSDIEGVASYFTTETYSSRSGKLLFVYMYSWRKCKDANFF